jgi:hypothetical protein
MHTNGDFVSEDLLGDLRDEIRVLREALKDVLDGLDALKRVASQPVFEYTDEIEQIVKVALGHEL